MIGQNDMGSTYQMDELDYLLFQLEVSLVDVKLGDTFSRDNNVALRISRNYLFFFADGLIRTDRLQ